MLSIYNNKQNVSSHKRTINSGRKPSTPAMWGKPGILTDTLAVLRKTQNLNDRMRKNCVARNQATNWCKFVDACEKILEQQYWYFQGTTEQEDKHAMQHQSRQKCSHTNELWAWSNVVFHLLSNKEKRITVAHR